MSDERCINCGDPDVDSYGLMVRNNSHDGVLLCEDCYEAIKRELE